MPRAKTGQVRGKPRGIRHDRDCRNCKTRGVKCDLNRPRCLPCVQADLACGGWPQRVVWTSGKASSTEIQPPNPANASPRRRAISRRQESASLSPSGGPISVISFTPNPQTQLERNDGSRPPPHAQHGPAHRPDEPSIPPAEHDGLAHRLLTFCRSAKPMDHSPSTNSDGLNHAVSADRVTRLVSRIDEFLQARMKTYASTSFAPLPPTPSSLDGRQPSPPPAPPPPPRQDDGGASELHRLAALASLSEVLDTADPVAFVGIAVFAFFEVVSDAAFGEWQTHLRGARSLLDYHCRSREELDSLSRRVNGLTEILGYFSWWDVIGITIRRLSGRHSSQDDEPIFLDWHRSAVGDEFFGAVGCPPDTFQIFALLADTSSLRDEDAGNSKVELDTCVQAMGQLLRLGSQSTCTDQGKCGDAWRCAAAIAVLTWQQPRSDERGMAVDGGREATLDAAVDRICELIASASPSSRFYVHMAAAAFCAGINTRYVRHCEVLRNYWKGCRIGEHPRYWGAYTECEERWKRKELL